MLSRRLGLAFLSIFSIAFSDARAEVFGRYSGVLRHESLKRDQLARLDLIAAREDASTLELVAVLTVYLGDYKSNEYVSYHFDNVRLNLLTQTLIFDQPDQDVTVVVRKYSDPEIEAEFRSNFSGDVSKLILSKSGVKPTYPLMESLWGEYRGKCKSIYTGKIENTALQLQTFRSSQGAEQVGNPFRAYQMRGQLAEESGTTCLSGESRYCNAGMYSSGTYNFYKNRIQLFGSYRNLTCQSTPEGLQCNDCEVLKRSSRETAEPRALTPALATEAFTPTKTPGDPALTGELSGIQGEYRGYVYHDNLGRYQPASLNILTYQAPSESGTQLRMSAVATAFFGDFDSPEAISYRFAERLYPNPLSTKNFLFRQKDSDVDAILQVTEIGKGVVKGIWFSQLFGRVGEFEFHQGEPPKLPTGAKVYELISGRYSSTDWDLNLAVGLGTAAPNTQNPFAPLSLEGYVIMRDVTPRIYITGGSFDFYTGKIGFEVGEKAAWVGDRASRKWLKLKKTHFATLSPLQPHEPLPFQLTGGN